MHMSSNDRQSHAFRFARALGAPMAIAVTVATAACGARDLNAVSAQPLGSESVPAVAANQPAGTPVVVSCEPNQRTIVRPVVVNGAALSQVECITSDRPVSSPRVVAAPAAQPLVNSYRSLPVSQPADDLGDARIASTAPEPASAARPVQTRQVVYDDRVERPVKRTRSVKKSAVIIGSSAGVGAGVGAAVGGKKGALLGAVIGGGGAAVWDQITRRDK
jgi:hypothetical protein